MIISNLFSYLSTKKAIFIIAILGIIVFFNGLINQFVIDDNSQITENVLVHSLSNIPSLFTGSTFYGEGKLIGVYYKPITLVVFSLIYNLFGSSPFWFHFLQLILHIINASLVFLLFKYFFSKTLSLVLSLIFLVHPINSEAVFYISNMQEVLFFLFGILALNMLIGLQSKKYFYLIPFLLFLSILSKETGILFFCVSIIYTFLFRREYLYPLLGYSTPLIAFYILLRINAVGVFSYPLNSPISGLTLSERLVNIPAIIFFYIKTFLVPIDLASSYQWAYKEFSFNHFILPLTFVLIVLSSLLVFAIKLYRKQSRRHFGIYLFFGLWLLVGLLMHLQVVPLDETVSERWFYFPIVGILGITGVLLKEFYFDLENKWVFMIAVIVLMLFSVRTFMRGFDWRDDYKLAMHDIQVSNDSYGLEHRISYGLAKQGKFEEAKIHAERSISIYPYFTNYNDLGSIYLNLKEYEKAKQAYLTGLQFGDYYAIYENLALMFLVYGDQKENVEFIKDALKKFPQNAKLWLYLAVLEYRTNSISESQLAIQQAHKYSNSRVIGSVYNRIMNNQPLNLNVTFEY